MEHPETSPAESSQVVVVRVRHPSPAGRTVLAVCGLTILVEP
jgi:hypothetical protein